MYKKKNESFIVTIFIIYRFVYGTFINFWHLGWYYPISCWFAQQQTAAVTAGRTRLKTLYQQCFSAAAWTSYPEAVAVADNGDRLPVALPPSAAASTEGSRRQQAWRLEFWIRR